MYLKIQSISQLHELLDYGKPKHPLITLIEGVKVKSNLPMQDLHVVCELFAISLKNGSECALRYGRQNYDFQEGSMIFLAPGQSLMPIEGSVDPGRLEWSWTLCFHPDLIRKSGLAKRMGEYGFFSYEVHEALHVSDEERSLVTGIVHAIREEYSRNLDAYSGELIVTNLDLLLNHCKRFYGRQFITRAAAQKDIVSRFEEFLGGWMESADLRDRGLPSVRQCADAVGYSPNYLSDLLREETGKNTLEHIHFRLVEKAKDLLLGTQEPVSQIAYRLGFEYPQHFSKLFKGKTGKSPTEYRM